MSRSAASEAGKPILLPAVLAIGGTVAGIATAWADHSRMVLKMGWLIAIYSVCGVAVLAAIAIHVWGRRKRVSGVRIEKINSNNDPEDLRKQRFLLRQEKWKEDLGKEEKCPASDCKSKGYEIPRRQFYRSLDGGKIRLPMLCDHCFKRLFNVWPQIQHQCLRVWSDNLTCSVPSCGEDAISLGADDNPYCIAHMHKGGASRETVITSAEAPLTQVILIPGRELERPNMSNESLIDRFAKSHRRD